MKMFALIAYAVVLLTLAVLVLSAIAVLARYLSDLREARIRHLRGRMQRSVEALLAGPADMQAVIRELGSDPDIALGVLIDAASRLPRAARRTLRGLFEHFQFLQQELLALRSRRWALRVRAATRLGYMGHERVVPDLIRALDDEMLDVRMAAARALAQLGAVQAVRPILRALALPGAWPLQRAAEILHEMGNEAAEPLTDYLDGKDPQKLDSTLVVAVRVLGMLGARRAVPLISGCLRSPDPELRLTSAKALGQIGDPQAVPVLDTALGDPAWEVRSAAAQALGRLGNPHSIPALNRVLADPAWWTRFNAADSLYRLGAEGQACLKNAITNHTDAFARDISRQMLEERGAIPVQEALPA